jgi:hypothetical protein
MKKSVSNKKRTPVLVFNPLKRLIGYFHSLTAVATAFKTTNSAIHQACAGPCISSCGLYFRFLANDMEIEDSDYGTLRLENYDQMCGVTRAYYPTSSMSRKGMRTKQPKNDKK